MKERHGTSRLERASIMLALGLAFAAAPAAAEFTLTLVLDGTGDGMSALDQPNALAIGPMGSLFVGH